MDSPVEATGRKRKRKARTPYTPPGAEVPQLAVAKAVKKSKRSSQVKKVKPKLVIGSPECRMFSSMMLCNEPSYGHSLFKESLSQQLRIILKLRQFE